MSAAAAAPIPSLLWKDVKQLSILCEISGGTAAQRSQICARLLSAASHNAPMVVKAAPKKDSEAALPQRGHAFMHLSGKIGDLGTFGGTLQTVVHPSRIKAKPHIDHVPIALTLGRKPIEVDGPIYAALSELLPWRQLQPVLRKPPPRQY